MTEHRKVPTNLGRIQVVKHQIIRVTLLLVTSTLMTTVSADEEELYPFGRVFTERGERYQLDHLKRQQSLHLTEDVQFQPDIDAEPGLETELKPLLPATELQFSGYIRRADGRTVLWVDGTTDLSGGQKSPGELLQNDSEAVFRTTDQEARLRPGQTWMIESGRIAEVYQHRKPVIAPDTSNDDLDPIVDD